MPRQCSICGGPLRSEVVNHYRPGDRGRPILYQGVRRLTCVQGCRTAYYDFTLARQKRQGLLGSRGDRPLNVVDPLFFVGLLASFILFMSAVLLIPMGAVGKLILMLVLTSATFSVFVFYAAPRKAQGDDTIGDNGAPAPEPDVDE